MDEKVLFIFFFDFMLRACFVLQNKFIDSKHHNGDEYLSNQSSTNLDYFLPDYGKAKRGL